jgi:hypothetical protein
MLDWIIVAVFAKPITGWPLLAIGAFMCVWGLISWLGVLVGGLGHWKSTKVPIGRLSNFGCAIGFSAIGIDMILGYCQRSLPKPLLLSSVVVAFASVVVGSVLDRRRYRRSNPNLATL